MELQTCEVDVAVCGVSAQIKEDWKYIALVLDRLFLWLFTTACTVGTLGIIFQAPTIYDSRPSMTDLHQDGVS